MQFLELFLSTIMNPPSFNDWQAMNDVSDMIVTGIAMLIRLSTVPALIFFSYWAGYSHCHESLAEVFWPVVPVV